MESDSTVAQRGLDTFFQFSFWGGKVIIKFKVKSSKLKKWLIY